MKKLLETIKIVDGKPYFLEFHNKRLNHARKTLFKANDKIDLYKLIKRPPPSGFYRCRVIYTEEIETIEYISYHKRKFNSFKIVQNDSIAYDFKYLDRQVLEDLTLLKGRADDILIVKNGWIADTTIANVAFWYQGKWITPATPLLQGTTRERLLTEGKIVEEKIGLRHLKDFSKMVLMNALMGFYVVENFELVF